jgi:sensor histidine kinase regulating citrate/malate metabolism
MIEVTILISVVSVFVAVASFVTSFLRNTKKDNTEEVEERASMNARLLTKLDVISDDVREIKKDNQTLRTDINSLSTRITVLEQQTKFGVNFASGYAEKADK